jgi:hypothetical protein
MFCLRRSVVDTSQLQRPRVSTATLHVNEVRCRRQRCRPMTPFGRRACATLTHHCARRHDGVQRCRVPADESERVDLRCRGDDRPSATSRVETSPLSCRQAHRIDLAATCRPPPDDVSRHVAHPCVQRCRPRVSTGLPPSCLNQRGCGGDRLLKPRREMSCLNRGRPYCLQRTARSTSM